ncbi:MAG TPA: Xaa-Pro peptidase family protein [Roseiflexaceae bacterium]|nr:Xaa-Pro peptidase family protein [Roseiflexaceae bacterium]
MKQDLDHLMAERGLDALVIEGPDGLGSVNADYNYFVGGQKITGVVLKKRGEQAVLVYGPMERQQAESTGLRLVPRDQWNMRDILREIPDPYAAQVEYRRRMFSDLGITGKVGFYGTVQAGPSFALLAALSQQIPGLQIMAEFERDVIAAARLTKDEHEIALMREAGRRTCLVSEAVVEFLRAGRAEGDILVDASGSAVTIGRVKELIRREVAAQGLELSQGLIFAQGRDAGLPHAHGEDSAPVRLGDPIVFDLYPRVPGGYYHDMTRTFAVGHASPALRQLYDDVKAAFDAVVAALRVGEKTLTYQQIACDLFEQRGHATVASTFPLEEGFVHSLGHGIGLQIHENLKFPYYAEQYGGDVLLPGVVFTIEPGLYYPSRGMGVRIEDTFCCLPDGSFESLTPFGYDLVIPLA